MTAPLSWVHSLSLFVLLYMAIAVISVRRGNICGHAGYITGAMIGASVIWLLGCG